MDGWIDRSCRFAFSYSKPCSFHEVSPAGALRAVPGSSSSAAAALWDGSHWGDLGRRGQRAKQGGSWGGGTERGATMMSFMGCNHERR